MVLNSRKSSLGLHFFRGRLRAVSYGHFLDNELQLHLENDVLQTRQRNWIKYKGAPP